MYQSTLNLQIPKQFAFLLCNLSLVEVFHLFLEPNQFSSLIAAKIRKMFQPKNMFRQLAQPFVIATPIPIHCETQITSSKCFYL